MEEFEKNYLMSIAIEKERKVIEFAGVEFLRDFDGSFGLK